MLKICGMAGSLSRPRRWPEGCVACSRRGRHRGGSVDAGWPARLLGFRSPARGTAGRSGGRPRSCRARITFLCCPPWIRIPIGSDTRWRSSTNSCRRGSSRISRRRPCFPPSPRARRRAGLARLPPAGRGCGPAHGARRSAPRGAGRAGELAPRGHGRGRRRGGAGGAGLAIHEPPAESARGAAAARNSAGRDGGVLLTRRGSGRPNDAADDAPIALAGGGLMNRSGEHRRHRSAPHHERKRVEVRSAPRTDPR